MASLFDSANLLKKDGSLVPASAALAGKEHVLIYFSAHWCPPCRGFTPKLADWYKARHAAQKFEVVFVSSDKDQAAFDEYYGEMPWITLPFGERALKEKLSKQFGVSGIPSLVVVSADGTLITTKGRDGVSSDPENVPWKPEFPPSASVFSVLEAASTLVTNDGKTMPPSALRGRSRWALYFSAHWCGPCRGFTPMLAKFYESLRAKGKDFEIVFVSSDKNQAEFDNYMKEHPWKAIPFNDPKAKAIKAWLDDKYEVEGIPTLLIFDETGEVFKPDGRSVVQADPDGSKYPWPLEPFTSLTEATSTINEIPLFMGCSDLINPSNVALIERVKSLVAAAAAPYYKDSKPSKQIRFAHVTADDDPAPRVRTFLGLTQTGVDANSEKAALFAITNIPDRTKAVWQRPEFPTEAALQQWVREFLEGKAETMPLTETIDPEVIAAKKREAELLATWPDTVTIANHPHPLEKRAKLYGGQYGCDVCSEGGSGPGYHCDQCQYDAHPHCAGVVAKQ